MDTTTAMPRGQRDGDPTADALAAAVAEIRAGRNEAWAELWRLLEPTVSSVARGGFRLGRDDAADIGQEVWLRLQMHLDRIDEPRAVRGWVRTTAHRECLRLIRRQGRETAVDDSRLADEIDLTDGPEQAAERAEVCQLVREAVDRLSSRRRELVRMLFAEGRDYAEIAAALSMPIGSIGPTRCRLIDGLRTEPSLARLG
ncbi:MAG: sigma-70 family RNA polymerase sigma factor [Actinomycetota bacterium]